MTKEELTKDTKELIRLYKKITGNTDVKIEGIMTSIRKVKKSPSGGRFFLLILD